MLKKKKTTASGKLVLVKSVRRHWTSGGCPFSADRSGTETAQPQNEILCSRGLGALPSTSKRRGKSRNESDEQFTDMKFMFSRYELKTITKRLVRGRNQSASEGKFLGSVAPYGYRAYKLVGMKGNSLRIEPKEAKVVRMIFDMYGKQGIGYNTIAHELNQMNIPSLTGTWGKHPSLIS